jgi:Copine
MLRNFSPVFDFVQSVVMQDAAVKDHNQVYCVLSIFTNGNVHNVEETVAALKEVDDAPLSVVVVGVGPSDFSDMKFLNDHASVVFVDMKSAGGSNGLAEQTLKCIPDHLVKYFMSNQMKPNAPAEPDEIVIEPFVDENEEGGQQGEVTKPPDKKSELCEKAKQIGMRQAMRQGRRILDQQKRKIFGRRGGRPPTSQQAFDKIMDQQVNKLMNMFK